MIDTETLRELAGHHLVEQTDFMPIKLTLGNLAYLQQGDGGEACVVIEPEHALALSDKFAAWGALRAKAKEIEG